MDKAFSVFLSVTQITFPIFLLVLTLIVTIGQFIDQKSLSQFFNLLWLYYFFILSVSFIEVLVSRGNTIVYLILLSVIVSPAIEKVVAIVSQKNQDNIRRNEKAILIPELQAEDEEGFIDTSEE